MKRLVFLLWLFPAAATAQDANISQFVLWKPKPGMTADFENGYKKHLQWHAANKDGWDWYAWYIDSGVRDGLFVDASFFHRWADFDKRLNPAEDAADNALHVYPFADLYQVFRVAYLPRISNRDSTSLRAKLLQWITLDVTDIDGTISLIEQLLTTYKSKGGIKNMLSFKPLDGTTCNQLFILVGSASWEEFGKTENLVSDLLGLQKQARQQPIRSVNSELLRYREDMSLFAPKN